MSGDIEVRDPPAVRARAPGTHENWEAIVGTVKKFTDTDVLMWMSSKVRQVEEGGWRTRTMYLAALAVNARCTSRTAFLSVAFL